MHEFLNFVILIFQFERVCQYHSYLPAESPLPLIDPQSCGDGTLAQHSILYPKPIHPNSGSEIEIELCEEDHTAKDDSSTTDSIDVITKFVINRKSKNFSVHVYFLAQLSLYRL